MMKTSSRTRRADLMWAPPTSPPPPSSSSLSPLRPPSKISWQWHQDDHLHFNPLEGKHGNANEANNNSLPGHSPNPHRFLYTNTVWIKNRPTSANCQTLTWRKYFLLAAKLLLWRTRPQSETYSMTAKVEKIFHWKYIMMAFCYIERFFLRTLSKPTYLELISWFAGYLFLEDQVVVVFCYVEWFDTIFNDEKTWWWLDACKCKAWDRRN